MRSRLSAIDLVGLAADYGEPACVLALDCTRALTCTRKMLLTPRFARHAQVFADAALRAACTGFC